MEYSSRDSSKHGASDSPRREERVVYVMPDQETWRQDDDSIDLANVWNTLWRNKWTVAAITAVFAIGSIGYALTLTHWYRSGMLLAPAGEETVNTGISGQLGSLAGLAGISISTGGSSVEALAVMKSRDFTRAFVEEQDLLPVLFADKWDAEAGRWIEEDPELWPDAADGARVFDKSLRRISQDRETGMVTVSVDWTDPELAAQWVTLMVKRLNDEMRARALEKAEANVAYLQSQISATSVIALEQAVGRLLEREQQKLMLARGNEEYAFRVIDSAEVPESPFRPNRRLMVIVATLFGGLLAVFFVLARGFVRQRGADDASDAPA